MAGSVASVLIPERAGLDEAQVRAWLNAYLDSRKARRAGNDFWLDERPFIVAITSRESEAAQEADAELAPELGWSPWLEIELAAMCNDPLDQRLLGEVCLYVARALDGIIDFGGAILPEPDLSGPTALPAVSVPLFFDGRGTLYAASYKIDEGRYGTCHYGDAALLQAWLKQPKFRMVK
jgi:Family of unknown function (DUF6368)